MIEQFQGVYRWLSNFYPVQIEFEGRVYPSVEHAYMSAKSSEDLTIHKKVINWKDFCQNPDNGPGKVKRKARNITLVDGWENRKLEVMETCLRAKFSQEPFKTMLLQTGNEDMWEGNFWGDKFWGVSLMDYEGENHLGKLIMKIRSEMQPKSEE